VATLIGISLIKTSFSGIVQGYNTRRNHGFRWRSNGKSYDEVQECLH